MLSSNSAEEGDVEREAEERLWEIVDQAEIALFITNTEAGYPRFRPLTLLGYEEEGLLWFATSRSSRKVEEIARDPKVTVCFLALEGGAYAQVFGTARLVDDQALKGELWQEEWGEYWEGPDDPDYVLIQVQIYKAEFYLIEDDELWAIEFDPLS
jgi:general stress protein 26